MKFIVVSSGSISGIGKGRLSSSVGSILQSFGYSVTFLKIDPYLNYNSGKMEPSEHGETYVLSDGAETDLDVGNYERYCGLKLTGLNSLTSGKVLMDLISSERNSAYNGKTIRYCNSFNEYVKKRIEELASSFVCTLVDGKEVLKMPEFLIIELGGTVGDDEALFFTKALSRFFQGIEECDKCFISIDFSIEIGDTVKTRMIQQSLNNFKTYGMSNDILAYRGNFKFDENTKEKISNNCGISKKNIIWSKTCSYGFEIPQALFEEGIYNVIRDKLCLDDRNQFYSLIKKYSIFNTEYTTTRKIGIVTRYRKNDDPYISLEEALINTGKSLCCNIELVYIDQSKLSENDEKSLTDLKLVDGIILPGGFQNSYVDTKVMVAQYARINNVPFLGICLGFQIQIIEFCRNVLGIIDATSEEFDNTAESHVIRKIVDESIDIYIGEYNVEFSGVFRNAYYKKQNSGQIFRHRYGLNHKYMAEIEENGLHFLGKSTDNRAVCISLDKHRFYTGVQYHPEFSSKPGQNEPIIQSFIESLL